MHFLLDAGLRRAALETPWKLTNELVRWLVYPRVRLLCALSGIRWGAEWRFYGVPIIQRHRRSLMEFGAGLTLRSSPGSNPLAPFHPVVLSTLRPGAVLSIGAGFGMTGGSICAARSVCIGNNVTVGANAIIVDTDFHPLDVLARDVAPNEGACEPTVIGDGVFIGASAIVLKGSRIGRGSTIGAGSVVVGEIPPEVIAAGNPARVIRRLNSQPPVRAV